MKNKLFSRLKLAAALSCLMGAQQAFAFSGPDVNAPPVTVSMTTEISNYSGTPVTVELYVRNLAGTTSRYSTLSVPDGGKQITALLNVAGLCPSYLTGKAGSATIQQMSCSGIESNTITYERCCKNLKFAVVKKQDGTYHFRKAQ